MAAADVDDVQTVRILPRPQTPHIAAGDAALRPRGARHGLPEPYVDQLGIRAEAIAHVALDVIAVVVSGVDRQREVEELDPGPFVEHVGAVLVSGPAEGVRREQPYDPTTFAL